MGGAGQEDGEAEPKGDAFAPEAGYLDGVRQEDGEAEPKGDAFAAEGAGTEDMV